MVVEDQPFALERACLRVDDSRVWEDRHLVVEEMPLAISVNGRAFTTAMLSPRQLREFVVGHLFTEGVIRSTSEIESLEVEGRQAGAIVANPLAARLPRRMVLSGCGGGSSYLDEDRLPHVKSDLAVSAGQIFRAVFALSSSPLHRETGGIHSAGLFSTSGEPAALAEDIGRHNAMDKVIGHSLLLGPDVSAHFAVCTGRISSEMVMKASRAGIPILASRGASTGLALDLAEKTGLCVVGFARGKRMNIYTHRHRVSLP